MTQKKPGFQGMMGFTLYGQSLISHHSSSSWLYQQTLLTQTKTVVNNVCVYEEMRGFFYAARGPNNTIDPVHSWHAPDLISSSPLFSRFRLSRISSKSSETNRSTSIFLSSLLHLRICSCDIVSLHQSGICSKGSCSSIEMISTVSLHHRFCSRAPSYLPLRQ